MAIQASWGKGNKLNRIYFYEHLLRGKSVLDIGCVVGATKPDWVHARVRDVAREVTGVDIDKGSIETIKQRYGVDIIHGDAQDFDLGKQFEVVHAAELIEHLDNASGFLKSVRRHMGKDSLLIITTPNGYRVANFLYNLFGTLKVNHEHTCWYCEFTLKTLLNRFGFEVVETDYIPHAPYTPTRKILSKIVRFFLPKKLAWNTLYVVARYRHDRR